MDIVLICNSVEIEPNGTQNRCKVVLRGVEKGMLELAHFLSKQQDKQQPDLAFVEEIARRICPLDGQSSADICTCVSCKGS